VLLGVSMIFAFASFLVWVGINDPTVSYRMAILITIKWFGIGCAVAAILVVLVMGGILGLEMLGKQWGKFKTYADIRITEYKESYKEVQKLAPEEQPEPKYESAALLEVERMLKS